MREATLIVARPGRLREALNALLAAVSQLEIVDQADDGFSAMKIVTERRPTLVLLDSTLPDDEVKAMVSQIKAKWPQTRCLVLADTPRQQQIAESTGADAVLLKGYPATSLVANIEKLLTHR